MLAYMANEALGMTPHLDEFAFQVSLAWDRVRYGEKTEKIVYSDVDMCKCNTSDEAGG